MDVQLLQIARNEDAPYLSREDLVCDRPEKTSEMVTAEGLTTMYDYGRWTLEGATYFCERAI